MFERAFIFPIYFTIKSEFARSQFHQHFTREFFIQTSFLRLEFGFQQTFVHKIYEKKVDEIDHIKVIHLNVTWGVGRGSQKGVT